jgi:hypothetical protein
VFTPRNFPAKSSSTYLLMPCTIDTTPIRNITLITTPTTVKKLLSFCTRIVCSASVTASQNGMMAGMGDYSKRSASTGSRRAARAAGNRPNVMPVSALAASAAAIASDGTDA